jgi:hypothetical protein
VPRVKEPAKRLVCRAYYRRAGVWQRGREGAMMRSVGSARCRQDGVDGGVDSPFGRQAAVGVYGA